MRIALINHYAGSPTRGMEYRPYFLAREWVRQGHDVTIVAASQSHVRQHNPHMTHLINQEMVDGVRYLWLWTPGYKGNFARAINIFWFVLELLVLLPYLFARRPPHAVIASSTYPLDNVPAWILARRTGARLVYEVHDLWPLSPMELGGMSPWHPFILVMQWAENLAYRVADHVVSLLPAALDHMVAHGLKPEKFTWLPNGISPQDWLDEEDLPSPHLECLAQTRRAGRFIVGYTGAHGIANALDVLLEAAALMSTAPVTFILVGDGKEKPLLEQRARAMGLTNVEFLPSIRRGMVPSLLRQMDILFIGLQPQPLFRFGVSPNKLMDYMMAGKPIVQAIQAGNDPVREADCGISVEPGHPRQIAEAVRLLVSMHRDERERLGMNGLRYVLRHHDYRAIADRFLHLLQSPMTKSPSNQPIESLERFSRE